MQKTDSDRFKFLFDKILLTFLRKIDYHEIKRRGVKEFFGYEKGDPFFESDDPTFIPAISLKGEILKNENVILYLKAKFKYDLGNVKHSTNPKDNDNKFYDRFPDYKKHEKLVTGSQFEIIASKFDGKNLYNHYNHYFDPEQIGILQSPKKSKRIREPYLGAYMLYANVLREELFPDDKPEKIIEGTILDKTNNDNTPTTYTGYYYDFEKRNILSFNLSVNYGKVVEIRDGEEHYFANQWGLHGDKLIHEGYAYLLNNRLHVVLRCLNDIHGKKEKIKIILCSGALPVKRDFMRGIILSIKSNDVSPVAVETIFINKNITVEKEQLRRIKRYLFLHMNNFRIKNDELKIERISTKEVDVDSYDNMSGIWRVWRFNEDWHIVTSLLYFGKDYRVYCYTGHHDEEFRSKQICTINPIRGNGSILSLSAYPERGTDILSSFMIKCPSGTWKENNKPLITGGVITLFAKGKKKILPIMRAMAMVKETKKWRILFDDNKGNKLSAGKLLKEKLPVYKTPDEIKNEISSDTNSEELFIKLIEISKKNTMPSSFKELWKVEDS